MADGVWSLSDVSTGLERRGYQRIASHWDGKLWYLSPKSTPAAQQYVVLEHKSTLKVYGAYMAFSNSDIRALRDSLKVRLVGELGESSLLAAPAWTTFDIGRALKWPLLGIPYPRERAAAVAQFSGMCDYLVTVLEPIDGPRAMLGLLMRLDVPFDWGGLNHPVRRAVELVATAQVAGHSMEDVRSKLLMAQKDLHAGLRTGPKWPDLVARICEISGPSVETSGGP
jgi:hypothetical protein